MILSIDLASRRYSDNGIALLEGGAASASVELIRPDKLGLAGQPVAQDFAAAILRLVESHEIRLVLLDGPQGWKGTASPHAHARYCERETLTPGKTGEVGQVKPGTWTRMAEFSIALFDQLDRAGWPRVSRSWNGGPAAIESFPTHAWRSLGHRALPGKANRAALSHWQSLLEAGYVNAQLGDPTHDELQAVVAGLGGLQLLAGGWSAVDMHGIDPYVEHGAWREGYIISPSATGKLEGAVT